MKRYTLYLGLKDKDTKTQKIDTIEAYKILENTLKNQAFEGATIFQAMGLYKHESGEYVQENTLRIELLFTSDEKIKTLCNTLKVIFNQESIALIVQDITSTLI